MGGTACRGRLRRHSQSSGGKEGSMVTFIRSGLLEGWGRGAGWKLKTKQKRRRWGQLVQTTLGWISAVKEGLRSCSWRAKQMREFFKIGVTQLFLQARLGITISGSKMMSEQELQKWGGWGQGHGKQIGGQGEGDYQGHRQRRESKTHTKNFLCIRGSTGRS